MHNIQILRCFRTTVLEVNNMYLLMWYNINFFLDTSSAGDIMPDGEVAYKFGNTTFLCEIQDFGFPEIESYAWKK